MKLKETLLKVQDEFITKMATSQGVTEEEVVAVWIHDIREALEELDNGN